MLKTTRTLAVISALPGSIGVAESRAARAANVIVRPPFVVARIDGDELSLHVLRRDADSLQGVDHLRQLAHNFGVFLTMGYFTYRSHRPLFSGAYTRLNISLLREWTGNPALPVHAIGRPGTRCLTGPGARVRGSRTRRRRARLEPL